VNYFRFFNPRCNAKVEPKKFSSYKQISVKLFSSKDVWFITLPYLDKGFTFRTLDRI